MRPPSLRPGYLTDPYRYPELRMARHRADEPERALLEADLLRGRRLPAGITGVPLVPVSCRPVVRARPPVDDREDDRLVAGHARPGQPELEVRHRDGHLDGVAATRCADPHARDETAPSATTAVMSASTGPPAHCHPPRIGERSLVRGDRDRPPRVQRIVAFHRTYTPTPATQTRRGSRPESRLDAEETGDRVPARVHHDVLLAVRRCRSRALRRHRP